MRTPFRAKLRPADTLPVFDAFRSKEPHRELTFGWQLPLRLHTAVKYVHGDGKNARTGGLPGIFSELVSLSLRTEHNLTIRRSHGRGFEKRLAQITSPLPLGPPQNPHPAAVPFPPYIWFSSMLNADHTHQAPQRRCKRRTLQTTIGFFYRLLSQTFPPVCRSESYLQVPPLPAEKAQRSFRCAFSVLCGPA